MKEEKKERPMVLSVYPKISAITEADRKYWWESNQGKGSYNSELLSRIIQIKRYLC